MILPVTLAKSMCLFSSHLGQPDQLAAASLSYQPLSARWDIRGFATASTTPTFHCVTAHRRMAGPKNRWRSAAVRRLASPAPSPKYSCRIQSSFLHSAIRVELTRYSPKAHPNAKAGAVDMMMMMTRRRRTATCVGLRVCAFPFFRSSTRRRRSFLLPSVPAANSGRDDNADNSLNEIPSSGSPAHVLCGLARANGPRVVREGGGVGGRVCRQSGCAEFWSETHMCTHTQISALFHMIRPLSSSWVFHHLDYTISIRTSGVWLSPLPAMPAMPPCLPLLATNRSNGISAISSRIARRSLSTELTTPHSTSTP